MFNKILLNFTHSFISCVTYLISFWGQGRGLRYEFCYQTTSALPIIRRQTLIALGMYCVMTGPYHQVPVHCINNQGIKLIHCTLSNHGLVHQGAEHQLNGL